VADYRFEAAVDVPRSWRVDQRFAARTQAVQPASGQIPPSGCTAIEYLHATISWKTLSSRCINYLVTGVDPRLAAG